MAYGGTLPTYLNEDSLWVFCNKQLNVNLGQELVNGYLLPDATISVAPPASLAIGSGAFANSCGTAGLTGADLATVQAAMNKYRLLKTP